MTRPHAIRFTDEEWALLVERAAGGSVSNIVRDALGFARKRRGPRSGSAARNAERNAEIIRRLQDDPFLRESELADEYGITRQAINLMLKRNGVRRPKAKNRTLKCDRCATQVPRDDLELHRLSHRTRFPAEHGRRSMYNQGCRCDRCREAIRLDHKRLIGRVPPKHGESGYQNYQCRCPTCKAAGSERNKRARAARRLREAA